MPSVRAARRPFDDAMLVGRRHKRAPHEFVLDAIASLEPMTRSMFGCLAVYVDEKIVLILRDRQDSPEDNGVWLATSAEHHSSLQREFPRMRSIRLLGRKVTHWQVLPVDAADFEESALRACDLIRARDPRIGRVPKSRISRQRNKTRKDKSAARAKPSELFRLSGGVKRDAAIENWLGKQPPDLGVIARTWFARMRRCGGDVRELMHDGCPVACVRDAAFAYVNAFKSHVNVGFYIGAELADPKGLLEGTGKRMRHVKLKPGRAVDTVALSGLIAAAYTHIRGLLRDA
ncbi:MAG TPA: DUF1801 domain-containing protein [Steroidobacteraceae bacterium]|nr:DUF1801 domain-containing protein [Steroidobacteraceae bacterium]